MVSIANSVRPLLLFGRKVAQAWKEDCFDPLPERWRRLLTGTASSAVITPLADGTYNLVVRGLATGRVSHVSTAGDLQAHLIGSKFIRLQAPPAEILCTRISIPKLAARDLEATTRLNIGVWTPFAAEEVYHASTLTADPPSENDSMRVVELRCIPCHQADRYLGDLRASAVEADSLDLDGDGRCSVPLRNRRTERRRRVRSWSTGLMLLLAAQVAALLLLFGHRQAVEVEQLRRQVEALGRDAHARIADDAHIRAARASLQAISDEVAAHGVEAILERLSSSLPQNAWLRELSVGPDRRSTMTLLTAGEADPTTYIKRTGLYQIDGVSEIASPNKGERYYSLDLSPAAALAPAAP